MVGDRDALSLVGYHYVAAGCSDAHTRYVSCCVSDYIEDVVTFTILTKINFMKCTAIQK